MFMAAKRAGKEVSWNITKPRAGREAQKDVHALNIDRDTKGVMLPRNAAQMTPFDKEVHMARGRAAAARKRYGTK